MGVLALAGLTRNSRRFVRRARIRRPNIRERSGAPCLREICFSAATENMAAQTTRSRRRADVRLGFHGLRGDSQQFRGRSVGNARKSGARSGTVDLRMRNGMTFGRACEFIRRVFGGIERARTRG